MEQMISESISQNTVSLYVNNLQEKC